jgi:hypothetical protein
MLLYLGELVLSFWAMRAIALFLSTAETLKWSQTIDLTIDFGF